MNKEEMKIDSYRLIPKGTKFWSIGLQSSIFMDEDLIVKIKHTCIGNDIIFGEPYQVLFNIPGMFPGMCSKGTDEVEISYSKTLDFEVPKPQFITFNYE